MNKLFTDIINISSSFGNKTQINEEDLRYELSRFHNTFILGGQISNIRTLSCSESDIQEGSRIHTKIERIRGEIEISKFVDNYIYPIINILNGTYIKEEKVSIINFKIIKVDLDRFQSTIKDRLVTYLLGI